MQEKRTQSIAPFHVGLPQRQPFSIWELISQPMIIATAVWGALLTYVAILITTESFQLMSRDGVFVLVTALPALSCLHVIGATIAGPNRRPTQKVFFLFVLAHLPMSVVFWVIVNAAFF